MHALIHSLLICSFTCLPEKRFWWIDRFHSLVHDIVNILNQFEQFIALWTEIKRKNIIIIIINKISIIQNKCDPYYKSLSPLCRTILAYCIKKSNISPSSLISILVFTAKYYKHTHLRITVAFLHKNHCFTYPTSS